MKFYDLTFCFANVINHRYQYFITLRINSQIMDIGAAFGIFLAISVILIGLSCILLKYYSYRRKKILQKISETYQIGDQFYKQTEQIIEGAYNEFHNRREHQNDDNLSSKLVEEDMLIEMCQIKQLLNVSNNIYGISSLRQRLNHDTQPMNNETNRSLFSLKSFRFERLNTMESSKTERKYYDFVKQLVKYSKRGITINQVTVESLKKVDGNITLNQELEEATTLKDGQYFQDLLQIYGFEKYSYGFYKYVCSVDITDLKQNQTYHLAALKSTDSKQMIFEEEYFALLKQMTRTK